jgi:hypothetical protein
MGARPPYVNSPSLVGGYFLILMALAARVTVV